MRIALVSPYDYPFPGGVTEHIEWLAATLEQRGHYVRIFCPTSDGEAVGASDRVYRLGSIVRVPYHGSLARITLSLGLSRRVRAILARERFDVVHLHEPLLPTLPLTVLWLSPAVNVGTFHASWPRSRFYRLGRPLLGSAFRRLHGRIAVSEAARAYVARHFPADYAIIPNGVDTRCFRPDLEPLPEAAGVGPSILFVGRLEPRKGFAHLLQAFARLARTRPDARLLVAGAYDDRQRRHFAALADALGAGHVTFLGRLPRAALARCYASADVCCFPSTGGESFGIVLLEAMAAGRPVVCSDITGYREVVRGGREALLVPPGDAPALAGTLERLLGDPALQARLADAGRQRAAQFDWPVVAARVEAYYRLCQAAPPAGGVGRGVPNHPAAAVAGTPFSARAA